MNQFLLDYWYWIGFVWSGLAFIKKATAMDIAASFVLGAAWPIIVPPIILRRIMCK